MRLPNHSHQRLNRMELIRYRNRRFCWRCLERRCLGRGESLQYSSRWTCDLRQFASGGEIDVAVYKLIAMRLHVSVCVRFIGDYDRPFVVLTQSTQQRKVVRIRGGNHKAINVWFGKNELHCVDDQTNVDAILPFGSASQLDHFNLIRQKLMAMRCAFYPIRISSLYDDCPAFGEVGNEFLQPLRWASEVFIVDQNCEHLH